MSRAATDWAWDQEIKSATSKLILLSMADRADEKHCCFPSIQRLVKDTSLDRKTIQSGLARLVDLGLIKDTGERKGTTRRVKVFQLELYCKSNQKRDHYKQAQNRDHLAILESTQKRDDTEIGNIPGNGTLNEPEIGTLNEPEIGLQNQSLEPPIEPMCVPNAFSLPDNALATTTSTHTERMFKAALVTDRAFPMTEEWQPSKSFVDSCKSHRIDLARLSVEQQDEIICEFRSYWMTRPGTAAPQNRWEHRLRQQIKRQLTISSNRQTQAAVDLDDTSWGDDFMEASL